ncbi:MAG TPA: sulfite exporter TauE/SafE family protein [Gammaproteobacteria bacterium]|nr:sulfite exporter TauE/SafE family protein [Gammaproteobacteria bacterium]
MTPTLLEALLYLFTGACAGFAAGLLGVGGGLIIVPVLYFVFNTQGVEASMIMHMALTTSLASIVITAASSTYAHHKRRAVLWSVFFLLTPGILLGAWSGGLFASAIDSRILKGFFAVFELLVAIHLLLKTTPRVHRERIGKLASAMGGFVIGFVSSLVGIGGGTMTVPFLHWFNIPMKKAVATSAACGLPIALAGSLSYISASYSLPTGPGNIGYLNLYALLFIAIASFAFAPVGAKVAHSISEKSLRLSFSALLFALSLGMLLN